MKLPRKFGPYLLLKQIASGGMAEIYLAKTIGLGGFEKYLAIKTILKEYSQDSHFINMLIEEAKIAVQLTHPNIVQVFDLGKIEDTYYIAMEYIDGTDIFKLMKKVTKIGIELPIDSCVYIAHEICSGLEYAHNKRDPHGRPLKIVHRDISPQNILISYAGEIKIVDFGIAKASSKVSQTQAGVIKGKYYYMSPEQAWGDPVDHRTDIFSTGIILYEMLAGRMVYLESNFEILIDRVRKANIPPLSKYRRDVPKELEDIIMKALQRFPEDRYQSAGEFGDALLSFLYSYSPDYTSLRLSGLMKWLFEEEISANREITLPRIKQSSGINSTDIKLQKLTRAEYLQHSRHSSVIFNLADFLPKNKPQSNIETKESPPRNCINMDYISSDELNIIETYSERRKDNNQSFTNFCSDTVVDEKLPIDTFKQKIHSQQSLNPHYEVAQLYTERELFIFPNTQPENQFQSIQEVENSYGSFKTPSPQLRDISTPRIMESNVDEFNLADVLEKEVSESELISGYSVYYTFWQSLLEFINRHKKGIIFFITSGIIVLLLLIGMLVIINREPKTGELEVVSVPEDVKVYLNGVLISQKTPIKISNLELNKSYELKLNAEGYLPWTQNITLDKIRLQQIAVLTPIKGVLHINSIPKGAKIYIDDIYVGTTPIELPSIELNRKIRVQARIEGYQSQTKYITWEGEKDIYLEFVFKEGDGDKKSKKAR